MSDQIHFYDESFESQVVVVSHMSRCSLTNCVLMLTDGPEIVITETWFENVEIVIPSGRPLLKPEPDSQGIRQPACMYLEPQFRKLVGSEVRALGGTFYRWDL